MRGVQRSPVQQAVRPPAAGTARGPRCCLRSGRLGRPRCWPRCCSAWATAAFAGT